MLALITRTIYVNRKNLLACFLISAVLTWVFVAFFPTVHEQAEKLSELVVNYPEAFLKAFGVEAKSLFLHLESFLAAEHYSFMWPLILIVLIISLGSSAIAGEIEQGTIEVLLAQPISRARIYWAKFIAGFLILLVFIFASVFSVVPFAKFYDVEISLQSYLAIFVLGMLFGLAVFCLTMMFSSLFSTKGRVTSFVGGILISMYAIKLISALKESVQNLKYLSLFHYYDCNRALVSGKIDPLTVWVFLGVSLICSLIGAIVFAKRDIST